MCTHTCTIVNSTFVDFQRGNLWLAAPIVKLTLALEGDLKAAQCGEAIWKLQLFSRNWGNDQNSWKRLKRRWRR